MAKHVVVIGPVEHDGTVYLEGEELSLSDDAAAALVAVGVIGESEQPTKPRKGAGADVP